VESMPTCWRPICSPRVFGAAVGSHCLRRLAGRHHARGAPAGAAQTQGQSSPPSRAEPIGPQARRRSHVRRHPGSERLDRPGHAGDLDRYAFATRNFYGVLRVWEINTDQPSLLADQMTHGKTVHGFQFRADDLRRMPTTFYAESSGLGYPS